MNFPIELKPFMRCKTANGQWWVVVPSVQNKYPTSDGNEISAGDLVLTRLSGDGWVHIDFESRGGWQVVQVADVPRHNAHLLYPDAEVEIVWDSKTAKARAEAATVRLQIEALTKRLKELEKEFN